MVISLVAFCSSPTAVVVTKCRDQSCLYLGIGIPLLPSLDCSARIKYSQEQPAQNQDPAAIFPWKRGVNWSQVADGWGGGSSLRTRHVSHVACPSLVRGICMYSSRLLPSLRGISSKISDWHHDSHPLQPHPLKDQEADVQKSQR